MQFKKKVQRSEYWTVSRTVCDRCKKPLENGKKGNRDEVQISAQLGDVWPEGDFRDTIETDCCTECWETVVFPALIGLGFTFRTYDTEQGLDYAKMPEDPEVEIRTGAAFLSHTHECRDNCPEWWVGPWQDWHRGHRCNKDDGKPRSLRGESELQERRGLPPREKE